MTNRKPPDSITAAILADPKAFLTPDQQRDGQPSPQIGDALADAKDAAAALKAVLQDQPMHVGDERSGQLTPPDNPLLDKAATMKPSASITEAILADPKSFLAPEQSPRMGNAVTAAKDVAAALKAMLLGQPVHVGNEQSGQLRPPDDHSFER